MRSSFEEEEDVVDFTEFIDATFLCFFRFGEEYSVSAVRTGLTLVIVVIMVEAGME